MNPPFTRKSNWIARFLVVFVSLIAALFLFGAMGYVHSSYSTGLDHETVQPIPFSHQHHVQGLGLDCRYCHSHVEISSSAGYPDSATCMGCHSQIWPTAPVLNRLRESFKNGQPLSWTRVHQLPDYVYFDHSIHVNKGVSCVTCHGRVSEMSIVAQKRSFLMKDCQSCHDHPEKILRPSSEIFNENWKSADQVQLGQELLNSYNIHALPLKNCSVCHR